MILRSFLLNYTITFFFIPKLNTALYFQGFYFIFEIASYADQVGLKLTVFEITFELLLIQVLELQQCAKFIEYWTWNQGYQLNYNPSLKSKTS